MEATPRQEFLAVKLICCILSADVPLAGSRMATHVQTRRSGPPPAEDAARLQLLMSKIQTSSALLRQEIVKKKKEKKKWHYEKRSGVWWSVEALGEG